MILTITLQIDPINNSGGSGSGSGSGNTIGAHGTLSPSLAMSLTSGAVAAAQASGALKESKRSSLNVSQLHTVQHGSRTYTLDEKSSYRTVFLAICLLFGIPEAASQNYCLQVESSKKYLNWPMIADESKTKHIVKYLVESGESSLLLKFNPTYRSEKWVRALNEDDNQKDIIFHLKFKLQESEFAESFIEQGGVDGILRMVLQAKGNAQTYALGALRACLEYVSGMDIISKTPALIKQLFSLVDSSVVGVCRSSLELLFVMCNIRREEGYNAIHLAAKSIAQAQNKPTYSNLVKLLDSGDLETKINSFTLLNVLLDTCPSDEKTQKLVKKWGDLGLHDKLRALTEIQHKEFQIQLELYEDMTGIKLRTKASRLEEISKRLKSKLNEYQEQQPLINILKEELRLNQQLIKEASNDRIFLNSHPVQRFLGPLNPTYPVDLSFLRTTIVEREKISEFERKLLSIGELLKQETRQSEEYKSQVITNKKVYDTTIAELTAENQRATEEAKAAASKEIEKALDEALVEIARLKLLLDERQLPNQAISQDTSSNPLNNSEKISNQIMSPDINMNGSGDGSTSSGSSINPDGSDGSGASTSESGGPPPPPPPAGGGPPPPPPPPLPGKKAPASIQPTKPVISPSAKMKPLYWKRIVLAPSGRTESIWDQILEPTFNSKDFEELFCQKKKMAAIDKTAMEDELDGASVVEKVEKVKLVSVIDLKKSNAIAFMLAKLPPVAELKGVIDRMDSNRLNKEVIKTLMQNAPTEEDYQVIKASQVPVANLDRPERWILEMYQFPSLAQRLRCWLFTIEFAESVANIQGSLDTLDRACKVTKDCENLKKVLGIVLVLGNYMNGGSSRGQADGFNLEILDALATTKDIDNKQTLLEYIARLAVDKYPKTLQLADELEPLRTCQLSLSDIQTDMGDLDGQFNIVSSLSTKIIEAGHDKGGGFGTIVPNALAKAEADIKRIKDLQKATIDKFHTLLEFFGYSKTTLSSVTCQQFFGAIFSFSTSFSKLAQKIDRDNKSSKLANPNSTIGEGKKIGGGSDPLAALANAIKLGQQIKKKNISIIE